MKKITAWIGVIALATCLLVPGTASAITFFGDRATWEAAAGSFLEADLSSYYGTTVSSIDIPYGETLSFSHDLAGGKVGLDWATWSGGKQPYILKDLYSTGVTGSFNPGQLAGFGMEIEPNSFSQFLVSVTLSTGDVFSQQVIGASGAKFFGWIEPLVVSMSISVPDGALGYAFGEIVATSATAVPEPGTLLLLGGGLVALAGFGRKFRK